MINPLYVEGGKLIVTLGLEVYRAIKAGQTQKTVGEIFDGARSDWSEIERLEQARFGAPTSRPTAANPHRTAPPRDFEQWPADRLRGFLEGRGIGGVDAILRRQDLVAQVRATLSGD